MRAIKEAGLAQGNITELSGPYTSEFIAANQLNQVTDVRINRATEKSMDRVFMYVPNSLSFSDTIDYDEGSQSALRTFYEASAGKSLARLVGLILSPQ